MTLPNEDVLFVHYTAPTIVMSRSCGQSEKVRCTPRPFPPLPPLLFPPSPRSPPLKLLHIPYAHVTFVTAVQKQISPLSRNQIDKLALKWLTTKRVKKHCLHVARKSVGVSKYTRDACAMGA